MDSSKVGEFVEMTEEQLKLQINNINYILYSNNMLLKYYICSGKQQLVAGMNYKIIVKYYKKHYLIEYYVSLLNEILNIKINKYYTKCVCNKTLFYDDTFTIEKCSKKCNK